MSEEQTAEEWLTSLAQQGRGAAPSETSEEIEEPQVRVDLDLGNAGVTMPAAFQSSRTVATRAFADWLRQ